MPTEPLSPERLDELARRCEAAEGPDRELDARIWCALNGKRYAEHWGSDYDKGTQVGFTEPPKRTVIVTKRAVPNVTASLDAALTLVDDQLITIVVREALDRLDQSFNPMDSYLTKLRLFVLAAALRARAKEANDGNE